MQGVVIVDFVMSMVCFGGDVVVLLVVEEIPSFEMVGMDVWTWYWWRQKRHQVMMMRCFYCGAVALLLLPNL